MILFADESVDRPIVERLRQDGHDTVYVAEQSPSITDDEVLQEANSRSALLLTEDKDFGELVYRLGRVHGGIVLIRLAGLPAAAKADTVAGAARTCRRAAGQLHSDFTWRGAHSEGTRCGRAAANQRLKLTGAAILVFRDQPMLCSLIEVEQFWRGSATPVVYNGGKKEEP
jgi:predicted nuclease of predicted toxin-antitoxin system